MAAATSTTLSALIKQMWPENRLQNATYKKNPLWAMIAKKYNFFGDPARVAIRHGDIAGRSATFTNAQANAQPTANKGWLITRARDYAVITIDGEAIDIMDSNEGAILDAIESEMDSAVNAMNRSCGRAVYGTTVGTIGKRSSISSNTVTLTNAADAANFEVNMTVGAVSDATGSGTQRSGTTTVSGIDRVLGTVTLANAASISGFIDGDFLFPDGDYNARFAGFRAWVPDAAPSATTFFGVDRTADVVRLGGGRYDATTANESIEEALIHSQALASQLGGNPRHAFMNSLDLGQLLVTLGTRQLWVETKVAGITFKGVQVSSPDGEITVYSDYNCPKGRVPVMELDSWFALLTKKPCRLIEQDGLTLLRSGTADQYEGRLVTRGNFVTLYPGHNINLKLTSTAS